MNNQLRPEGIGTDDQYDVIARQLYEKGEIPFVTGYEYFEAFKDSLLCWNFEKMRL